MSAARVIRSARLWSAAALLAATPSPAHAHLVTTRFGDFYGGLLHPLLGFESALPWLALGLLAGLHGERTGRWIVLAFPAGVAFGIALSLLLAAPERLLLTLDVVSLVVIGALVALAQPLAWPLFVGLGALFGVLQGWENALATDAGTNVGLFAVGVTVASYAVITLVTAATVMALRHGAWVRIAVRAAGSWITAVGLLAVGVRLVGA